jgi:hypothetical protein
MPHLIKSGALWDISWRGLGRLGWLPMDILPETFKTSLLGNKFRNISDRGFGISFKFKQTRDTPGLDLNPILYK